MRTSILSAAFVAAIAATTLSPSHAQAQVVVSPGVTVSPYGIYPGYSYPSYQSYWYNYQYSNPYPGGWNPGYANSYNYANYAWYNSNPAYTSRPYGYMSWPNYMYRGWNGRSRW
jgi:hypothetical protein